MERVRPKDAIITGDANDRRAHCSYRNPTGLFAMGADLLTRATYLNSAMRQEQFWCQRDTGLDIAQGYGCRKPLCVNHCPLLQGKVGIGKDDRDVSRHPAVV